MMEVIVKVMATTLPIFLIISRNLVPARDDRRHCSRSCDVFGGTFECNHHHSCPSECDYKCNMNCKGGNCTQSCNAPKTFGLNCHGEQSDQTCNNKHGCNLKCSGGKCFQTCNGRECSLECYGNYCKQNCNMGTCNLKCHGGKCEQKCNRNCTLECREGSCEQDCTEINDGGRCRSWCPFVSNASKCDQNCGARNPQCTKNLIPATTEASPTTVLEHCYTCTVTTSVTTASLPSQLSLSPSSEALSTLASTPSRTAPITKTLVSSLSSVGTPSLAPSSPPSSSSTRNEISVKSQNISRTEELVVKFISALNKTKVQQHASLKHVVNLLHNTTEQLRNISHYDVKQGYMTELERKGFIFKGVIACERFFLNYGRHHLNESMPQLTSAHSKLVLHIQRVFGRNGRDFHLEGPEKENFITIPSRNFHSSDSVLVGIVYKDLHELLKSNSSNSDTTKNSRSVGTIIMAATVDPRPKTLQQNVVFKFKNLRVVDGERFCMFWSGYSEKNPDGWSDEGCHVVRSKSSSVQTECSCNHMTHFAVLFDYGDNLEITKTDDTILTILTYIGLALSIIGIILTIIPYVYFTDVHQPLSQIRISLASSLGAGQVIFLAGINATGNTAFCVAIAAIIQYFLMAAFCWMLVEGIYLYLFVVKVYNINNKMTIYHVMSWCLPAVMVAISLSIAAGKDGIQSFVSDKYCWISSDNNLIWTFVSFVVIIEVVNLSILARVMKEMATMQSADEKHVQQIKLGLKACAVLIPLLGVTWLFGLLSPQHKAFVYIFTILNSAQGFLIFLLHCLRNSQIKERFRRRINVVFPRANDENHAKKASQFNRSDVGAVKKIEVQPCSDSVFELR